MFSQQNFEVLARLLVKAWGTKAPERARYLSQWSGYGLKLGTAVSNALKGVLSCES